jgi:hypothetical protein
MDSTESIARERQQTHQVSIDETLAMMKERRQIQVARMHTQKAIIEENRRNRPDPQALKDTLDEIGEDIQKLRSNARSLRDKSEAQFLHAIQEEKRGVRIVDMDDELEEALLQPSEDGQEGDGESVILTTSR